MGNPPHTCVPAAVSGEDADAAFRFLYAEHGPTLLRLATTLTGGDRGHAEELVQETMLRAWTRRNNLDMHEGIGSTRRRAAVTMAPGHGVEVTVSRQPLPGPLAHLAPVLQKVSAG